MSDLQFSFTRKQVKTLLAALEVAEESTRGEPGNPNEVKNDEYVTLLNILEKRLETKTPEQTAYLIKAEKKGFEQGANNRSYPSEELPDWLLAELEELDLTEDAFLDAYGEGFSNGREVWLSRNSSGHKNHIASEEQREAAIEAGMLHGCQGYNEVMGYD